jgi:hypothetical protein
VAIRLAPLRAWHLRSMKLQPSQAHMRAWITDEFLDAIEHTLAYTVLDGDEPLASAGIAENEHIKRYAWALLSEGAGKAMVRATRACLGMVSRETETVFTHVRADLPANVRWLTVMGFAPTGKVDRMPDGHDMELWARAPG